MSSAARPSTPASTTGGRAGAAEGSLDTTALEPEDLLILLHIPKTGGSSLERALVEQLPPEASLRLYGADRTAEQIHGQVDGLGGAARRRLRLLTGHQVWFGIHRLFPERRPRYVTWLRDPVARVLSNYWKIRRQPSHHLHGRLQDLEPIQGLEVFLSGRLTPVVLNHMTVFLGRTGTVGGHDEALCSPWDRELLERALAHLRDFWFIGLQESYATDLAQLGERLGVELREHQVHRAPTPGGGQAPVPLPLLEACAAQNRMDALLFHAAVLQRSGQRPPRVPLRLAEGGRDGEPRQS
jgi:hypothetical protein